MYVSFRCGCAHIVWCGRITHLGFRDTISRGSLTGGATRGPKGAQFPARGVTMERRKISTMSQYFLQHSTFASERPQVRTWRCQTCFLLRAPSNLVAPLSLTTTFLCSNAAKLQHSEPTCAAIFFLKWPTEQITSQRLYRSKSTNYQKGK